MAIKITFVLHTPEKNYEDVISNIQRIEGLDLKEARDKKGDIICSTKIPDENAERTAYFCSSMCNVKGVESIEIFVASLPDKETQRPSRWLPYTPMILSSAVTFFMIFSVLGTLGKDSDVVEVIKLAGLPAIVVFLSQLGYATQERWISTLKKIRWNRKLF